MTRSEFDQQIRELKNKRNAAIREVAALQSEIKEEIASKNRMIKEIGKEVQKLKQSLQGYNQRRIALDAEWNSKINAFIKENVTSTTSNLAEANTLNIIYELRRRGFKGVVMLPSEDGANVLESFDLDKNDWNRDNED
jgi:seryl-tRNA synthetase